MTSPGIHTYRKKPKVWAALTIALLDGIVLGMLLPLLPFMVLHFGGSAFWVAQLLGLYSLAGLIGSPLIGHWSDLYGRSQIIVLTLLGTTICAIAMAFTWSLFWIVVLRAATGFFSGRGGVLRAYITDGEPSGIQVKRLGTLTALGAIGATSGPFLISMIGLITTSEVVQFRVGLLAVAGLSAMTLVMAAITFRWSAPHQYSGRKLSSGHSFILQTRKHAGALLLTLSTVYAQGTALSLSLIFANVTYGWGSTEAGWFVGLAAAAMAVSRLFWLSPLVRTIGAARVLLVSMVLSAATILIMPLAGSSFTYGLSGIIFYTSIGIATVIPTTMIAHRSSPQDAGFAQGLNQSTASLSLFVSASVNGAVFDVVGASVPFYIAGSIIVIAIIVLALALLRPKHEPHQ